MDLCRLCYLGTSLQACKNLFDNQADNPPLLEIITKLTDLKIYENDPYPKIICTICYNSLLSFYKFRQNVLQTDSKFRHEFRNNNNNNNDNHNSNNNAGIIELLQIKTEEDLDDLDDMKVNINETVQEYSTIFTNAGIKEDENSEEPKINVINSLSIMGTNNKSPTKEEVQQTNCKISSSPDIRFQCKICEKTFTRKSTLKFHQRLHTNEKPYECNFCNRKYLLKSSFTQHLIAHTSLYKCEICGKKCAQRSHLIDHLKFHTGEKSHKCNVCEKGFALKSTLKDHMRLHTGEKPYQCDVCNKQFSQNAHLYVHTKVHTGEKPYECTICKKKFARKGHLNRHVKTHIIT